MVIGRGRRREHPNQHCLLLLRVLHNFRLRTPKGNPEGRSSDLRSHPVAMLLLLRKKRGKKQGMRRTYFQSGPLPDRASPGHVTDVTSAHVTDVTAGHAYWSDPPHDPPQIWLELCPYTTVVSNPLYVSCFVFLRLVYSILPVSLDCPFVWLLLRYSLTFIYDEL